MPYIVAIVCSCGVELQRRAARTEPEWTFADLYLSLSISDEYQVLDIKISSNGKTEWVSVEVIATAYRIVHYFFWRIMSFSEWQGMEQFDLSTESVFSVLMKGAHAVADKRSGVSLCLYYLNVRQWQMQDF